MITTLIFFFLVAIVISFLCSMWEAVLLSITPSYAQIKLKEGSQVGKLLKAFKANIDRPLAAILTLNTIAHTVGAVGVGNQAAKIWVDANPLITGLMVPVVMTLAILILSELIPKTLGANFWRELAPFTVQSLAWIIKLLYPLVWFSQFITVALKKDKSKSVLSRLDLMAMAEVGTEQGVLEPHESEIISNLLKFNNVRAKDIMTPRTVVMAASRDLTIGQFFEANRELRFSRILLFQGTTRDQVTGYFLTSELLGKLADDKADTPIHTLERKLITVHETFPIPALLNRFLAGHEHIALVVGEFGDMAGIVTIEDVIETLLGVEIVDEFDPVKDMQALARKNWEKRAKTLSLMEVSPNPGTESGHAQKKDE